MALTLHSIGCSYIHPYPSGTQISIGYYYPHFRRMKLIYKLYCLFIHLTNLFIFFNKYLHQKTICSRLLLLIKWSKRVPSIWRKGPKNTIRIKKFIRWGIFMFRIFNRLRPNDKEQMDTFLFCLLATYGVACGLKFVNGKSILFVFFFFQQNNMAQMSISPLARR